jgi:hypothetical protein
VTFQFAEQDYDPLTLSSVVGQAIGAGSTCWESLEDSGVYQSDRAVEIMNATIEWIEAHYAEQADTP